MDQCSLLVIYVSARLSSTFTSVDEVNGTGGAPDSTTVSGPLHLYEHRLETRELRPDENQLAVVQHLQRLSDELDGYKHRQQSADGMFTEMSTVCSNCHLCCCTKLGMLLIVLGIFSSQGQKSM